MTSNANAKELPSSWIETTFGEIAEYVTSGSRDWSKYYSDKGALFIRTQDINTNRLRLDDIARVELPTKVEGKRTRVYKGDVLITITGANVGKVALVESDIEEAYVSQSVALVRLKDKRVGKFLHYQLTTKFNGDKTHLEGMAYGLGRPVLNLDNIRNVLVRLAPLDQQKRIVAEIEKQFSRLDEAVANLKRVKANLKRYKAAVLKAAVEGRLVETEAEFTRREGRSYETGEQLLQRILETRRSQWKGKGKYKEPAAPDTTGLPELPEGWLWATTGQLCDCIVPNRDKPRSFTGEIPWLTLPDFHDDAIVMSRSRDGCGLSKNEIEAFKARVVPANSVVMSCVGRFGITAVLSVSAVINQQLHAFLPTVGLVPRYHAYALRTRTSEMIAASTATTIAYLNKDNCNSIRVPLPPVAEQCRIVSEVERHLSFVREVETQVDANLKRAERMHQSILAQSFSGAQKNRDSLVGL